MPQGKGRDDTRQLPVASGTERRQGKVRGAKNEEWGSGKGKKGRDQQWHDTEYGKGGKEAKGKRGKDPVAKGGKKGRSKGKHTNRKKTKFG